MSVPSSSHPDLETEASTPGRVRLSRVRYARHYPFWPLLLGLVPVVLGVGVLTIEGALGVVATVLLVLALVVHALYWAARRAHFWSGCANPAIVLEPDLWAAWTDLGNDEDDERSFQAVKVVRKSLRRHTPPLRAGDRLPTVSLYRGKLERDHWDDFDPIPVGFVADGQVVQDVLSRLDDEEWQALEAGVAHVPRPFRPGLYRIGWPAAAPRSGAT